MIHVSNFIFNFFYNFFYGPSIGWYSILINQYIRQPFWKWYFQLSSRWGHSDQKWQFFNYGYASITNIDTSSDADNSNDNNNDEFKLIEVNELLDDKCGPTCLQLYHEVIKPVLPITGLNVVEIGSGHGGGAVYVAKYLKPKTLTCIEISNDSVIFSNQYQKPKCPNGVLHFQQGDATAIPLLNCSYDIVMNVESSHCYSNFQLFVQEVYRILKPGGMFVIADLRLTKHIQQMEDDMTSVGFDMIENVNITQNVMASMELCTEMKTKLMLQVIGPILYYSIFYPFFINFAALKGSQVYESYKNGTSLYKRYVLKKPIS